MTRDALARGERPGQDPQRAREMSLRWVRARRLPNSGFLAHRKVTEIE
jgi:hypothetical protein